MIDNHSLNGLNPSEIEIRETELANDLNGLKMAILVIANLWAVVSLNCAFTSDPDTVCISVKSITDLFFYFVVGTRPHNSEILNLLNHI